jgi:hypothetical protein
MRKPAKMSEKKFKRVRSFSNYKNIVFMSKYGDNQIAMVPTLFPRLAEGKNISQIYLSSSLDMKHFVNNCENMFNGGILSVN